MKVKLVTAAFVSSFFIGGNWVLQRFHTMAHGTEPIRTVESAKGVAALTSTRLLQRYGKHVCSLNLQDSKLKSDCSKHRYQKGKTGCSMMENFCPKKVSKKPKG